MFFDVSILNYFWLFLLNLNWLLFIKSVWGRLCLLLYSNVCIFGVGIKLMFMVNLFEICFSDILFFSGYLGMFCLFMVFRSVKVKFLLFIVFMSCCLRMVILFGFI